jgi:ArsR family transcriptional regulator
LLLSGEMCVCEIEACLGLTQSNASKHLNVLKNTGILSHSRQAQWTYYKLNENFCSENKALITYLSEKLKLLPSYKTDCLSRDKCKQEDICNKME